MAYQRLGLLPSELAEFKTYRQFYLRLKGKADDERLRTQHMLNVVNAIYSVNAKDYTPMTIDDLQGTEAEKEAPEFSETEKRQIQNELTDLEKRYAAAKGASSDAP